MYAHQMAVVGVWLAELLAVPRSSLQDAVRGGKIASHKLGSGQLVVRIVDAKKWAEREYQPKSEG